MKRKAKKGKCKKCNMIRTYKNGGLVKDTSKALLHKGEMVINIKRNPFARRKP